MLFNTEVSPLSWEKNYDLPTVKAVSAEDKSLYAELEKLFLLHTICVFTFFHGAMCPVPTAQSRCKWHGNHSHHASRFFVMFFPDLFRVF